MNIIDRNTIEVRESSGLKVGSLPRTVNGQLAPLLDNKIVELEGVAGEGTSERSGCRFRRLT